MARTPEESGESLSLSRSVTCLEVEQSCGIALVPLRTTVLLNEIFKTARERGLPKPSTITVTVKVDFPMEEAHP